MQIRIFPLDVYEQYLSAFSAHAVEYKGILYPTVEHAYHCQRYDDQKIIEKIKNTRSAYLAWKLSQTYKAQQYPDFDSKKADIMEDICRVKLAQHEDVKEALLDSGEHVIVKDYPDSYWGIGKDGIGKNMMGVIWMKLRTELK